MSAVVVMALLIPSMASSTSSQKCLSVVRSGSPVLALDKGVILPSSYFYIDKGTPFMAIEALSRGVGVMVVWIGAGGATCRFSWHSFINKCMVNSYNFASSRVGKRALARW